MAFIPDNSFRQRLNDKISQVLWEFYQYLCIKRNHETQLSNGTMDQFLQIYGYGRASKFNLLKEMKSKSWIGGEDGKYKLLVGDFSPVNQKAQERKANREKQSKKIDSQGSQSKILDSKNVGQSKKIDEKSKKLDCIYKEYQLLNQQDFIEREINACASFNEFEPFVETARMIDGKFRFRVDLTLFWIQRDKKLSRRNFPAAEWLETIEKLALEEIHCIEGEGGFKHFYLWAESQDWVQTVTPNLLLTQIEKYKKREKLAAKKQNGGKNYDGNGGRSLKKSNRKDDELSDEEWNERNAHLLPS